MAEQRRGPLAGRRRSRRLLIGAVEAIFAMSFAALVFGGRLEDFIAEGISLYLGAAALTLGILAWLAGSRGVVGGLQPATAVVLATVSATVAVTAFGSIERAFLTVVAATLVVTVLSGIAFVVLGTSRRANLIRFIPYPVVGGFLAGVGWLLVKGARLRVRGRVAVPHADRRPLPGLRAAALGPGVRVRGDPARRDAPGEAADRDPRGARGRPGAVRDRDARHRVIDRERPVGSLAAARTVRLVPVVAAVVPARDHRRRLVGGGRPVGRDPGGRVGGNHRAHVQHLRERDRAAPGPGHQPGAPRRRSAERDLRRAGRDPGLPRPGPDRPCRADEGGRARWPA